MAASRRRLAPEVRTHPPKIEREDWSTHPNFPSQTLLLRSHDNFRHISRFLVETAESLEVVHEPEARARRVSRIHRIFNGWQSGMRGHEYYEESKLYPYLEYCYSTSLDVLCDEHERLHTLEAEVRSALKQPNGGGLHRALLAYHKALEAHLDAEEDLVIPMLLELTHDEFVAYYNAPRGLLLAELEQRNETV